MRDNVIVSKIRCFNRPFLKKEPASKEDLVAKISAIKTILNQEYADLMHDMMLGGTYEEIMENNPNNSVRVEELKSYLETMGIPILAAPAIYNYSVNSDTMLSLKRGTKSVDELREDVFRVFRRSLSTSYPEDIAKMMYETSRTYFETCDWVGKSQKQIQRELVKFSHESGIPTPPLLMASYELNKIEKTLENIPILESALENNQVKVVDNDMKYDDLFKEEEAIVLYRAVRPLFVMKLCDNNIENLVGKAIVNDFPTSTSKTYEQSFGTRKGYDVIFEIKVPAGSRGIDIEALSNYGKQEGEVLLAKNRFLVDGVEKREDSRGQMKYFVSCILDQRELLQEKDSQNKSADMEQSDDYERN